MVLWEFIETKIFPLFGTIPTEEINLGWFGTFAPLQFIQFLFWLAVGVCTIHFLYVLPYRWILSLMGVKKWRGKK